jgi:MFS-type transporter involved in bile tolerance (Atg22 family)
MTTASPTLQPDSAHPAYRRRINAWALYDVANSAFFTTILAAVLPTYYSAVAGATLPSAAIATRNWSLSLSLALAISALISPVLGTLSDVIRGKKRLLAAFTLLGSLATGALVLVGTGDWLLASVMIVIARVGAAGANVFYDSLLPHIAREEDQDAVSTRGFALGYLGGGVLLAINVVMINVIPAGTFGLPFAGVQLSFVSVAIWWTLFTLPLLFIIPEPQTTATFQAGQNAIRVSFQRLGETLRDIRGYRHLFQYLIAFLIYNDGIGTIIGVAVIYGAELGFETTELILALLLVQFVGIPFSFVFGNLPNANVGNRHYYLAFILANVVLLPAVGVIGRDVLPTAVSGAPPAAYATDGDFVGEGIYGLEALSLDNDWTEEIIAGDLLDSDTDVPYGLSSSGNAAYSLSFNGQSVEFTYATGPDFGTFAVLLDGSPLLDDEGEPTIIDAYNPTVRYGVTEIFTAPEPGQHMLTIQVTGESNAESNGTQVAVAGVEVLPPHRGGDLLLILGGLMAVQVIALAFAFFGGARLLRGLADTLNTKRSILLALIVYGMIAVWGYFVNSTIEFWFLAWMVAIVQGGSQALSRSLYASMSPAAKSGEFFGLYSIMAKFSSITGPLLFAGAVTLFGSSRPAILSLIALFIIGGVLLARVDVEAGRQVAREENARFAG